MSIIKMIFLWFLCLIAFLLISPLVMLILDIILSINLDNVILTGFKVGVIAWSMLLLYNLFFYKKNKQ